MPENDRIFDFFISCDTQLRYGTQGWIRGLDWGTVMEIADHIGIETDRFFFSLLKVFDAVITAERNAALAPPQVPGVEE